MQGGLKSTSINTYSRRSLIVTCMPCTLSQPQGMGHTIGHTIGHVMGAHNEAHKGHAMGHTTTMGQARRVFRASRVFQLPIELSGALNCLV